MVLSSQGTSAAVASSLIRPEIAMIPPVLGSGGNPVPEQTSDPQGFIPAQIIEAYGINSISFASGLGSTSSPVVGDGTGQTIAIVDAYDDPAFVDSTSSSFSSSDLAQFDSTFGIPNPPSFEKINQDGGTNLPGTDPVGAGNDDWEGEESLDVEWAHAIAPGANIILVECDSPDTLYTGVATAANLPGVSVISMSFGSGEYGSENQQDSTFTTPTGHQGVTFLASTGDDGYPGSYPAYSPNVVGVGGTSLFLNNDNSYNSESGWSDGGGGTSLYESEPSFQNSVQNTGQRTEPDVSIVADPYTGVAIYDSYDNGSSTPWEQVGGTSLSSPVWGALVAIADQGRVLAGGTTLDGPTQTLPDLYALPTTDFHDITSGDNGGESAGPGYDQVTGIGSPIANELIPDLAYYGLSDKLVISSEPSASVTAGSGIDVTVEVETAGNAIVTGAGGSITLSIADNPGGGTLTGTVTVTLVNGVATFVADKIDTVGQGYTLKAAGPGYSSAVTTAFNIVPASAAKLVILTEPPSTVNAGSDFGLAVEVEDAYGNIATEDASNVTLTLASGPNGATLGGTDTAEVSNGVATFTSLLLTQAGTNYSIAASDGSIPSVDTINFQVVGTTAATLVIESEPPANVTAGQNFGLTIEALDSFGNVVSNDSATVTIAIVTGTGPTGATLGGTITGSFNGSGLAVFTSLQLTTAGSGYELFASSAGVNSADSSAITVNAGAAAALRVSIEPPALVTAGAAFGLTVQVTDQYGNLRPLDTSTISLALGGTTTASLGGTVSEPAVAGVAAFTNLLVDTAGSGYTIIASDGSFTSATSSTFTVQAAAASRLLIYTQPPTSVTAGNAFGLKVTVDDQYGNLASNGSGTVTISIATGPIGATLNGTLTAVISGGLATFSGLTLDTAASNYSILAADGSLASATTSTFSVVAAAASQLAIVTQPTSTVTAGSAFDFKVDIEDRYGNVETSSSQSVSVALLTHPTGASLAGTVSLHASGGVANFSTLDITLAGSNYSLSATATGLPIVDSSTFTVVAGAATQLAIAQAPPSSVVAGGFFGLAISIEDAYGNLISSGSPSISISLGSGPAGGLLVGTTARTATSGVATFSALSIDEAGSTYSIEASSLGLSSVTTSAFTVTAAAAAQLVVTQEPPVSVVAGKSFGVAVQVEDQFGNVATTSSDQITLTLANPAGSAQLDGETTATVVQGTANFIQLVIDTAGPAYTIDASDGTLNSVATTTLAVTAAAPAVLVVGSEPPATITAGTPFSVQYQIEDQYGNLATTATNMVSLELLGGSTTAALGGSLTAVSANGLASFSGLTLTNVASGETIEANSTGLSSAVTVPLTIQAAAASGLVITSAPPATVSAGSPFSVTLDALDPYGNLATSDNGSLAVSLAATPGGGLGGTNFASVSNGVATFSNLILDTSGTNYVFSFGGSGLSNTLTGRIAVVPGPVASLTVIAQPPSSIAAGDPFGVGVAVVDAFGNLETAYNGVVQLAQAGNPTGEVVSGTLVVVASGGLASFSNLALTSAASGYSFVANSGPFTAAATNAMTITPAAAYQMVLLSAPSAVTANRAFSVSALVEDAYGNVDTSYTGSFNASLVVNPTKSKLLGTLSVSPTLGIATFSDLAIKKQGKRYELQISSAGLPPLTTSLFNANKFSARSIVKNKAVSLPKAITRVTPTIPGHTAVKTRRPIV